jgi:hypothetical protein
MTLEENLQDLLNYQRRSARQSRREYAALRRMFQETDRRIAERTQETDRLITAMNQEAARLSRETDLKINRVDGKLVNLWGRLVEAIVQPSALKLFNAWGVPVTTSMERVIIKRPGYQKEIDILLVNGDAVVVVEVKTTLTCADGSAFTAFLRRFHDYMPAYRSAHVLGGLAYMHAVSEADRHAARQGLFIIGLTGEGLMEIRNDAGFQPRHFELE